MKRRGFLVVAAATAATGLYLFGGPVVKSILEGGRGFGKEGGPGGSGGTGSTQKRELYPGIDSIDAYLANLPESTVEEQSNKAYVRMLMERFILGPVEHGTVSVRLSTEGKKAFIQEPEWLNLDNVLNAMLHNMAARGEEWPQVTIDEMRANLASNFGPKPDGRDSFFVGEGLVYNPAHIGKDPVFFVNLQELSQP